jgi:PEGA domain-containing protein
MFLSPRFDESIAVIVCLILSLSSAPVAQIPASDFPRFTKEEIQDAVNSWKNKNKYVKVDRSAARSIQAAFIAPAGFNKPAISHPGSRNDFLIGSYLDELRDRKYVSMGSPSFSRNLKISLTSTDVEGLPVRTFLARIPVDIWPEPGELTVISAVPGASISIDGEPRGVTNKDFVVPKGKHDIIVRLENQTCEQAVLVMDDLFVFRCPRQEIPGSKPHKTNRRR